MQWFASRLSVVLFTLLQHPISGIRRPVLAMAYMRFSYNRYKIIMMNGKIIELRFNVTDWFGLAPHQRREGHFSGQLPFDARLFFHTHIL